jgi:NADPH-dependent 2,4-dienoyl-CoA reductase/sulfur reductase-like enzyme
VVFERNGDKSRGQVEGDLVVYATGVQPNTAFLEGSPLQLDKDHGIVADTFLRTNLPSVFVAGDVASYPYWYNGERVRVEHYNEAVYQGSVAALNMMGRAIPHDSIPYFWTNQFGKSLKFTGVARGWDGLHIQGSLEKAEFIVFYGRGDKVIAAASVGKGSSITTINEAMRLAVMPSFREVVEKGFSLEQLLARIREANPGCKKCGRVEGR